MSQTLPKNYSSNPYPYSEFKEVHFKIMQKKMLML